MLLAVLVGVPLGIRAATGGRWTRTLTESFVVFGISVPDFWLGIMLVLIFSATLAILPPSGYVPFATDPIGNLRYMALPVLTLAAGEAAYILRTTRGAISVGDGAAVRHLPPRQGHQPEPHRLRPCAAQCRPVDRDRDRHPGRRAARRRDHHRDDVRAARRRAADRHRASTSATIRWCRSAFSPSRPSSSWSRW